MNNRTNSCSRIRVSVPYRGATFLNHVHRTNGKKNSVSVPYRGATFLNNSLMRLPAGGRKFPSPIGELHFSMECYSLSRGSASVSVPYRGATFLNYTTIHGFGTQFRVSVPYRGATFLNSNLVASSPDISVSVPYRGATFLNNDHGFQCGYAKNRFRPLSGSYISQYHPRNPMFCLGQIGGLRGKSNFIEMQPFWKVKNSHKSSI